MSTTLTFLGIAGYDIAGPERRILIDPCLTDNPTAPCGPDDLATPDVILVSHAAFDHLGDTAAIARRTGAPVVCGADVRALLLDQGLPSHQVRATVWGIVVEVGGVVVRPVECHHWSQARLADGSYVSGVPLGFIVETEPGVRIYHYGDTAIFGDLRLIGELYAPTVGLLGCHSRAPWQTPRRALVACSRGRCRRVRPRWPPRCWVCDWPWPATTWRQTTPMWRSSCAWSPTMTQRARVALALQPGQALVVDQSSHQVIPPPEVRGKLP